MPAQSPRTALSALLRSLFEAEELRHFIQSGPNGDNLVDLLPGRTAEPASLANEIITVLLKHGLLDAAFFGRLLEARPQREPDIHKVRALFFAPSGERIEAAFDTGLPDGIAGTASGRTTLVALSSILVVFVATSGAFAMLYRQKGMALDSQLADFADERATLTEKEAAASKQLLVMKQTIHMLAEPVVEGASLYDRRMASEVLFNATSEGLRREFIGEGGGWNEGDNLMRCVYGLFTDPRKGTLGTRHLLWMEVSNQQNSDHDGITAERVTVDSVVRTFPTFPERGALDTRGSLASLLGEGWERRTDSYGDLGVGAEFAIPMGHALGPESFSGVVSLPMAIHWFNPALHETQTLAIDHALLAKKLDNKLYQAIIGNLGPSCPTRP
jgi:hypothetical protein